jgi:DNA-binding CsgD family transcriptional regulator
MVRAKKEYYPLLQLKGNIPEGEVFNKWLYNRLIVNNKNVLSVITGQTGSGKSYQDLRRAELWYKYHFNEELPPENVCFSILEAMNIISSGKLRKGEIIILEEAGTSLGSLDFQNRICKLFTYVLQSFRSMNIAIFFNLPYLSMLNKQARMLLHVHFQTHGINLSTKTAKSKCFFRQVNQDTGKVYNKYLRIKHNGRTQTLKRFNYTIPSQELIDVYEDKKDRFLGDITHDFSKEIASIINKRKMRGDLTELQREALELRKKGMLQDKIAEIMRVTQPAVSHHLRAAENKGFSVQNMPIPIVE